MREANMAETMREYIEICKSEISVASIISPGVPAACSVIISSECAPYVNKALYNIFNQAAELKGDQEALSNGSSRWKLIKQINKRNNKAAYIAEALLVVSAISVINIENYIWYKWLNQLMKKYKYFSTSRRGNLKHKWNRRNAAKRMGNQ